MISVCIATYNGERYIGQQLASILKQIGVADEVIVSDDGSTDGTLNVVRSFNDPRVRIVKGPRRGSLIWNFEHVLKEAKGDYIFLSDQDDVWADTKVEVSLRYLQQYDCIVSDAVVVDSSLHVISESFYNLNRTKPGRLYNLIVKNGYIGCCMAFKYRILSAVLPFPNNIPMHDIWIGNAAAFKFKLRFVPEKLTLFRRHEGSSSTSARRSRYTFSEKIMFRVSTVKSVLARIVADKDLRLSR